MSDEGLEERLNEDEAVRLFFNLDFFKSFTKKEKLELANFDTYLVHFSKGDFIIREGGPNNNLFILLEGEVAITKKSAPDITITKLTSGGIFGEVAFLLKPSPRISNAVAMGKVLVLRLDKEIMGKISPETNIKIKDQLIALLIKKLDAISTALLSYMRLS